MIGGQFRVSQPSSCSIEDCTVPHDARADTAPSKKLPGEEGRHVSEKFDCKRSSFVDDFVLDDGLEADDAHEEEGQ